MKSIFTPFLPLLFLACASDSSGDKAAAPKSGETPPAAAVPADPVPAEPAKTAAQQAPAPAPTPPAPPAAVQSGEGTGLAITTLDADQGGATTTTVPGSPPGGFSTNAAPGAPAGASGATTPPAPQVPAAQGPLTPALPVPVVIGPQSKVDSHKLSGTHLGGPLQVFGKTISEADLKRYLCYAVGGKQIDSLKFQVMTKHELDKRKAAGEDVSKLVVGDAEFERALEKTRKDFLLKYPSLDFPTEVGRAFLSLDIYKVELKRTMLFDKVFFPEDPANWPGVTTEAIIAASGGTSFIEDSKESYAARKQMQNDQGLEDIPADDPILVDTLRGWLLDSLNQFSQVEFRQDKLPPDTLLVVDGVSIKVDEVWNPIQPHVTWENVADARRFLTQMAVVERELESKGVVIPAEEFEQNFMANVPFKDAVASYEMIAVTLQGFPSMHANLRYERMLRSYRKLIADELTNEKIQPFMARANMIAGAARTDAEVILATAFDYPNFKWKPDGWKAAEAKARELKAKLDAGADWGDTLELHSEYWDPPMPEVGQKPPFGFNFKGRFGPQTRNQLIGDVHESDFMFFLRGKSVGDSIFFDQRAGTISDVMEGSRGYYIARVNSRTPGSSGLNLNVPLNREFAVNFVAMNKFGAYARQLLTDAIQKGDVQGF